TTPLFVTNTYADGTRQPILGGLAAAAGPGGGVMVYFGTGSFSFAGDEVDRTIQSLYGVLDRGTATTLTRAALTQQTVTVVAGSATRVVSSNSGALTNSGWYLDLPAGERMVSNPAIEGGVVFIPTYDPNAATGCTGIGNNWLYGLNALTGGAAMNQVHIGTPDAAPTTGGVGAVALATGGTAPVKDVAAMAMPRLEPLSCAPGSPGCTETPPPIGSPCSMIVQVAGAPPIYVPRPCGRQSWRQVR
ncbi:MAG: pilus assembly protein, partial [Pseudoxanthomonas sp.]